MSNEEFERKVEFILDQQAQSTAKIGQIEDIVARLANASLERLDDVDERISALVDAQIRLTEAQSRTDEKLKRFDDVDEKINALVDSQIRLTESQERTAENLRALITVVDRYLSGNGRGNK